MNTIMRSALIFAFLMLTGGCGRESVETERAGPTPAAKADATPTAAGGRSVQTGPECTYDHEAIVRGSRDRKRLALIFTGGSFGEGTGHILDELLARRIKASFFVTGDYIRTPEHKPLLKRMIAEGHLLGPHSDAHLLYCPWDDRARTLVTREQFRGDLTKNLDDLVALGASRADMKYFVPPYEWYNEQIVGWAAEMGLVTVNFTPGTRSNADYLPESDRRFICSRDIHRGILDYEAKDQHGLRGFLLLLHVGVGPGRMDKMHLLTGPLMDELGRRGYKMVRIDQLLGDCQPGASERTGRCRHLGISQRPD